MTEWLDQFFTATAWPMDKPPAYGAFHILFTLIGFFVCTVLAWRLRKLDDKGNKLLLLGIGIFLVITEIYKQLFYFFYVKENAYDWGIFPFQMCSVPMYFCIIAPMLRKGTVQRSMYSFMMLFNLLGGAISFTEPSGLLHSYWTLTLHALLWHMALVFVGLYLCFSGRGGDTPQDYKRAAITFLICCAIAFGINLLFRDISGGAINMFFIGPSNSPIVVFKTISQMFGWYISTLVYIPAVCLGAYIIFQIIRLCRRPKT